MLSGDPMKLSQLLGHLLPVVAVSAAGPGWAEHAPTPRSDTWVVKDFKFHTGDVLPELRLHYTTLGNPKNEPVLILHGTNGSGAGMLNPAFGGQLFGPGQPLDANRYFIILPDALGTGKSTKPSDGLRTRFPAYNYIDMVTAQYRLVTEHLGIRRLRLVLGNSMGGMQTWLWATQYPDMMDIAVPMAAMPTPMSGRNWLLRRMLAESIRRDPLWMEGNYTQQPPNLQLASVFFVAAFNGGDQGLQKLVPTSRQGDAWVQERLSERFAGDANDHLYQWESSQDYDASANLERIQAKVLVINSADDERNRPELGVWESVKSKVKDIRVHLIPASPDTLGHGTTGQARFWIHEVESVLKTTPSRAPR
jgi:homoserine O-acetyltransferase